MLMVHEKEGSSESHPVLNSGAQILGGKFYHARMLSLTPFIAQVNFLFDVGKRDACSLQPGNDSFHTSVVNCHDKNLLCSFEQRRKQRDYLFEKIFFELIYLC